MALTAFIRDLWFISSSASRGCAWAGCIEVQGYGTVPARSSRHSRLTKPCSYGTTNSGNESDTDSPAERSRAVACFVTSRSSLKVTGLGSTPSVALM